MRVETQKKLYLTKEEREIISQFYDILDDDKNLNISDVWELFLAIHDKDYDHAKDFDYQIIVTD
jgi:hypothetical protein